MNLVDDSIMSYCEEHTSPSPPHLRELADITKERSTAWNMLSGHYQGRLLSLLSQTKGPEIAVEIGTFTGYSALCIAEGMKTGDILYTLDRDTRYTDLYDAYFKKIDTGAEIKFLSGEALESIDLLPDGIDLVFIDAAKSQYAAYLDAIKPKLSKGALVIADNVLWKGMVIEETTDERVKALQSFNTKVQADPDFTNLILPVRDGLLLAVYRPMHG